MTEKLFLVIFSVIFFVLVSGGVMLVASNRTTTFPVQIATPFPVHNQTEPTKNPTVTIVFTGDTMLDRNIRLKAKQNGYAALLGPQLTNLLKSADYSMTNLEGPVTDNTSVSVGSEVGSTRNFIFTFAPESTSFLKQANITIVNLGNNHILNFGEEGLAQTYSHLKSAEINYFGFTGNSHPSESTTLIIEHDGAKIGFVNYNQFIEGGQSQAFTDISNLKDQVDFLVMYTHWGNEYIQENQAMINLAHQFIDAGSDLIIGSHPHVINGHEEYQGKHIYYSLGNFIFDQYFDAEVKKGMVVEATITPKTKEVSLKEFIVQIEPNGETELSN